MTAALQELGEYLSLKRNDCVLSWSIAHDELTVDVAPSNIEDFVEFLKSDQRCKFSTLVDITGVDYPERAKRFDVIYHLYNCEHYYTFDLPQHFGETHCGVFLKFSLLVQNHLPSENYLQG